MMKMRVEGNHDAVKVDREDMLHLFSVNVAGVARVTEVCGVLRPGNTGGKVGCDWWRAGHVTSCSPLIGPGGQHQQPDGLGADHAGQEGHLRRHLQVLQGCPGDPQSGESV